MKHVLALALGLVFSASTFASQIVTLNTQLCGQVTGIQNWSFERSGNITNGVPDYQAYVRVAFLPAVIEGRTVQGTHTMKVDKLVWDRDFTTVLFQGEAGLTVCGKKTRFGGIRLSESCGVKFKAEEVVQSADCNNADATNFLGVFFVK